MKSILVITDEYREQIAALREYAKNNVVTLQQIKDTIAGKRDPIGDTSEHSLTMGNHRVVFSLEEQPVGLMKHLSVSVLGNEVLPHPESILLIMKEFGFQTTKLPDMSKILKHEEPDCVIWKEAVGKGFEAINVLERDDKEPEGGTKGEGTTVAIGV